MYPITKIFRRFSIGLFLLEILVSGCKKDIISPAVSTNAITNITQTTASSGGNITVDGGAAITARGVCWSTDDSPMINGNKTIDGTGVGSFTSHITGLLANTAYYVRAYATNSFGTGYGSQETFTTTEVLHNGSFIDQRDGNVYKYIKVGAQTWMAENLAYLPAVSPSSNGSESSAFYYVYNYNGESISEAKSKSNYTSYGVLYNWDAAKISCPSGWHLPTDAEWTILGDNLGSLPGKKMKAITDWFEDGNGDNSSGFNALPGGGRYSNDYYFYNLGRYAIFWSSSEDDASDAWGRGLRFDGDDVSRGAGIAVLVTQSGVCGTIRPGCPQVGFIFGDCHGIPNELQWNYLALESFFRILPRTIDKVKMMDFPIIDNAFVLIWKGQTEIDLIRFGELERGGVISVKGTGFTSMNAEGFKEVFEEASEEIKTR